MSAEDPALARLIDQIRSALARHSALDIRGGSTKAFYGETPRGEPLEMTSLSGISSHDPSELVVSVRTGTPLADLEAALAEHGQCLPFEPPRFAPGGTVGGMVSAGLAGPSRAALGGVRDYMLGATMINGRAELMSFGGQVMKNVAGYDVTRLLAGSLGMLGVICEVSLKVLPMPRAHVTLRFELEQTGALARLHQWGGLPLPLNASAWWEGMLVIRLAGAVAAVHAAQKRLGGETVAPAMADAFWTGLRDQHDEFFDSAGKAVASGATLWRLSLPATAAPLALSGEQLIEWGGAQRWLCSAAPATKVREAAAAAGGHATKFRSAQRSEVFAPLAPPLARIHRELKAAFDPDGIFNPGRLYANL